MVLPDYGFDRESLLREIYETLWQMRLNAQKLRYKRVIKQTWYLIRNIEFYFNYNDRKNITKSQDLKHVDEYGWSIIEARDKEREEIAILKSNL